MKNPNRAMYGACYVNGGRDIEDYERTHYSDHCSDFSARSAIQRAEGQGT